VWHEVGVVGDFVDDIRLRELAGHRNDRLIYQFVGS
jgi:hypothetical protein